MPVDIQAPPAVGWIVRTLEEADFETWTVGGAVRDALSGRPSGDWDIATRARPETIRRIFRRTVPIRMDHGTVGVLARDGVMYEVTTFRRDVETTGRHAVVAFSDEIEEDLARRDFTINAVAWHPIRNEFHDPFGGTDDLERGLLRTVGRAEDRFSEDYLRVLRALRFAGLYGLRIAPATWTALVAAVSHMSILSPERIREELEKILTSPNSPSRALALYSASGVLRTIYPELDELVTEPRPGGGGWFAHALRTLDHIPPHRSDLRWAALFLGVGEPEGTSEASGALDRGHPEERALLRTAAILTRLRSSNARIREVSELAGALSSPPPAGCDDQALRRWIARVGRQQVPPFFRIQVSAMRADEASGGPWSRKDLLENWRCIRSILRSGVPLSMDEMEIGGRDLIRQGYAPGPHFGDVLDHLFDLVLGDPSLNRLEELQLRAERWMEERGIRPGGKRG